MYRPQFHKEIYMIIIPGAIRPKYRGSKKGRAAYEFSDPLRRSGNHGFIVGNVYFTSMSAAVAMYHVSRIKDAIRNGKSSYNVKYWWRQLSLESVNIQTLHVQYFPYKYALSGK
jgi:hypothetical protein